MQVEEEESDPRELGSASCLKLKENSLSRHPVNHGGSRSRVEMVVGGFLWRGA